MHYKIGLHLLPRTYARVYSKIAEDLSGNAVSLYLTPEGAQPGA